MSIFLETKRLKRLIINTPESADFDNLFALQSDADVMKYIGQGVRTHTEVMVIPGNEGAYRFWRSTIKNYTNNNFTEYTRDIAHFNYSRKNIFKFDSRIEL
jgi:hypothetical protein